MTPFWLSALLGNPEITDICLNGALEVYADSGSGLELIAPSRFELSQWWSENELRDWVLQQLSQAGKTWDARHPFIDSSLPGSGHRLHAVFPPVARAGILISLRRPAQKRTEKEGFGRWQSSPLFLTLLENVRAGDSLLVSGATGSGKTTLVNDLLAGLPTQERVIALEDTPELSPPHPHFLSLLSRPPNADGHGEVTLRTLLKQTLRMRPDRIVLGECRGPEVLDLLQCLNTGHRGALATLHANSPRDALRRIELLCLLASDGRLPVSVIRELLAQGIQWIAQVARQGSTRRITEVWRIEGREGDTILMRPLPPAIAVAR